MYKHNHQSAPLSLAAGNVADRLSPLSDSCLQIVGEHVLRRRARPSSESTSLYHPQREIVTSKGAGGLIKYNFNIFWQILRIIFVCVIRSCPQVVGEHVLISTSTQNAKRRILCHECLQQNYVERKASTSPQGLPQAFVTNRLPLTSHECRVPDAAPRGVLRVARVGGANSVQT